MMPLKNVVAITLLIILPMLMAKVKSTTNLRISDKKFSTQAQGNSINNYGLQIRHHNHFLHKKHKCNLDRFYSKFQVAKQSRYPTLDKIVSRLDNQIERKLNKLRVTTSNPYDSWFITAPDSAPEKRSKFAYVTVGLKDKSSVVENEKVVYNKNHITTDNWIKEGEIDIKLNVDHDNTINFNGKGRYMQDITTPTSWDNEQRDVSSNGITSNEGLRNSLSYSSTTTTEKFSDSPTAANNEERVFSSHNEKTSVSPFRRLIPRLTDGEDRKRKTSPMPYVAAHEHYEHVLRIGDCRMPKEKVIRVHEVHPDPSKSYSPSCTVLHQCGDDTGCCRDLKQVCMPKNTTKVELYFFTTTLGKPQTVEKLYFVNHTECECQRRTDELMPRDSEFRRNHIQKYINTNSLVKKKMRSNCTCPSRYTVRLVQNGTCTCDCFDKQEDCLVLKKGKMHFSYNDKVCIQNGYCLAPSCEFGPYLRHYGRCPTRRESHSYNWSNGLSFRELIT